MKKALQLIAFTLTVFFAQHTQAQDTIVNIPDAKFKAKLLQANTNNSLARDSLGNYMKIDINGDGEIQQSEASKIFVLNIADSNIVTLQGIESFVSLESIHFPNNQITNFDFYLPKLISLSYWQNPIINLNLNKLPKIESLICAGGQISNLDFSNVPNLRELRCGVNKIDTLDLSLCPNLEFLDCRQNNLRNLILDNPKLEVLLCSENELTNLDLSKIPNLIQLECNFNQLASLNLRENQNLNSLHCNNNQLIKLDLSTLPNLEDLDCGNNMLSHLDISNLSKLNLFYCNNNQLSQIYMKNGIDNTNDILYLGISLDTFVYYNFSNNPNLKYICADVEERDALIQKTNFYGYRNVVINSICSNSAAGSFYSINSTNLFDTDNNGCSAQDSIIPNLKYEISFNTITKGGYNFNSNFYIDSVMHRLESWGIDSNRKVYPNFEFTTLSQLATYMNSIDTLGQWFSNGLKIEAGNPNKLYTTGTGLQIFALQPLVGTIVNVYSHSITIGDSGYAIADAQGNMSLDLNAGTYTIKPIFSNPYFTISPAQANVTLPEDTLPTNFCISPIGNINDVSIQIIPTNDARPGFSDATYKIVYTNKGTTTVSGTIEFTFQDSIQDFVSSSIAPISNANGVLTFSYSNLKPFESRSIVVKLRTNAPTDNPAVNGGDILTLSAFIRISGGGDEFIKDNFKSIKQTVVISFDPNDKRCLEGDIVLPELVGDFVNYLIRFENEGTASAVNIVVTDRIDTTKFDIATLEVTSASHSNRTLITEGNKVQFIFDNIQLPHTEPGKHGYIAFQIKTKNNLVIGDSLKNYADIYFDYNLLITTNIAGSRIDTFARTGGVTNIKSNTNKEGKLSIYPNPSNGNFKLDFQSKGSFPISIKMIDINGRIVKAIEQTHQERSTIDISENLLSNGLYQISIQSGNDSWNQKVLIK